MVNFRVWCVLWSQCVDTVVSDGYLINAWALAVCLIRGRSWLVNILTVLWLDYPQCSFSVRLYFSSKITNFVILTIPLDL